MDNKSLLEWAEHEVTRTEEILRIAKECEEDIAERSLIAYCIVYFSEHIMLDVVLDTVLGQKLEQNTGWSLSRMRV